jgi:nucleoside-diphosphate-sugar epimerase
MNIVITGGRGFVGSNLIKLLKASGDYNIKVLTRGGNKNINGIEYTAVNYHDTESLKTATEGSDVIVHLAATLFARSRKEFIKENVNSTKNLVKAANENGVKKIVYISSLAAGGVSSPEKPIDENTPENPVSFYGLSKLLAEKELELLSNTNYIILRPPIIYGPDDDSCSTIALWVKRGIMVSPSNKNSMFSFIYVNDLCKCIEIAIKDNSLKREKFYLSEPNYCTWQNFIYSIADSMRVKRPVIPTLPYSLLYLTSLFYELISYIFKTKPVLNRDKIREAAVAHWIANPKKWEEKTGFKSWTSLSKGLKESFSNNL